MNANEKDSMNTNETNSMNTTEQNIREEILEEVSGGLPVGRDGKPISPAEYKNQVKKDSIHVTSGTF